MKCLKELDWPRKIGIKAIKIYQIATRSIPKNCRYSPTCSEYAAQAIEKHGLLGGVFAAMKRIIRCNQFFPGGFDPVK